MNPRRTASPINAFVACGIAVLLISGVLAFGAVEYWSVFVVRAGAALLLIVWAAGQARRGSDHSTFSPLLVPLILWAMLVLAQYISGQTAYRYATLAEAMNCAAYGIICFLAVQCFQDEPLLKRVPVVIAIFGTALACFALIQEATSHGRLYWLRPPQHGGSIFGPYVNHNHYAGLMVLLAPIPLVLCLSKVTGRTNRVLYGSAALLMSTSLFLSGSRGGVMAFGAQLLFLAGFLWATERRSDCRTWRTLLVVFSLGTALVFSLGREQVWSRLADLGHAYNNEVVGGRWTIYGDSIRMWGQRPVLGWGLGTFPVVFPQFRTFHSDLVTNQAHNDLLQVGVETGMAGFAIMLAFLFLLYRGALSHASLHRSIASAVRLGASIACTGLLVHSLVDFNLHIPANAALFFFLCGIASQKSGPKPAVLTDGL